jgi:hypothetical protein
LGFSEGAADVFAGSSDLHPAMTQVEIESEFAATLYLLPAGSTRVKALDLVQEIQTLQ